MKQVAAKVGPRIYNLFPTLAGPVDRWAAHAARAAAMGFNWLFLNPIHLTGRSGSLYAINDFAVDADLVETHPHWYRWDEVGRPYRPRVADPDNQARVTIWHDLAEFDYNNASSQTEMITFWRGYLHHFVALGV